MEVKSVEIENKNSEEEVNENQVEESRKAEHSPSKESPGGHELWPIRADKILLTHGDGPRNTVTIYFKTVNRVAKIWYSSIYDIRHFQS